MEERRGVVIASRSIDPTAADIGEAATAACLREEALAAIERAATAVGDRPAVGARGRAITRRAWGRAALAVHARRPRLAVALDEASATIGERSARAERSVRARLFDAVRV